MRIYRRRSRLIVLLLVFILGIPALPVIASPSAIDVTPPDMVNITDASIELYTNDDTLITSYDNVPQDAKIEINISFALDSAWEELNDIPDGTQFSLALPSSLTDIAAFQTISDSPMQYEGETYATFSVSGDGIITVTFNGLIEQEGLSAISGSLSFSGSFDEAKIGTGETIEFSLKAGTTYTVAFEDDEAPATPATIAKSGVYDQNTGEILWTVTATPGDEDLTNASVIDSLGANHQMIESSFTLAGASLNLDPDTGAYVFSLGNISSETSFSYRTKPVNNVFDGVNEGSNVTFLNDVALQNDGIEIATDNASVKVAANFVKKSGVFHTDVDGIPYILWSVDINNNHLTLSAPFTVSDTLPAYLSMQEDSLTVGGVPETFTKNESTYSYTFVGDISQPVQLQYITYIDEAYYLQQDSVSFSNTVSLTYGTNTYSDTASVGVGTSLLRKTGDGYDPATQLITWRMAINENGKNFTNAVIEDSIPAGQEYVDGSFSVINKDGATCNYDAGGRLLTITLGDITATERPVITYKTQVTNVAHTTTNNGGVNYSNTATLTGVGITNSTSTGTQSVKSTVLEKAGTYDYSAHRLHWTLTINRNGMPMSNLIVTDTISSRQAYVANSMKIDGVDYNPEQNGNLLTIDLGTVNETIEVTYETQLDDDAVAAFMETNQDITLNNSASLTSDYGQTVNISASVTVTNRSLSKSVKTGYDETEGTIEWEVKVNPQQVPLNNAVLVDILQNGLSLDSESIRLYKWNTDSFGNMTSGDLVDSSQYSFDYNFSTREFRFQLPNEAQGYILQFKTDVEQAGTYSNEINLNGYAQVKGTVGTTIRVNDLSASISGKNGSITVRKVDDLGNPITTGAVFELLDSFGIVKQEATTGENGEVTFSKLKLRSYTIREKTAPLGYSLNTSLYPVSLSSEDTSKTVIVANSPLTASITLHKESKSGKPLSGGTFAIYRSTNANDAVQQVSSINGDIVFTGLTKGSYIIRELRAPSGYKSTNETRAAELVLNIENNTLPNVEVAEPLINNPKPDRPASTPKPDTGSVTVKDEDNPPGTEIGIYDEDGNKVGSVTTDESGNAEFPDLPYGDYTVHPVNDPLSSETIRLTADDPNQFIALNPGIPKTGGTMTGILVAVFVVMLAGTAILITSVRRKQRTKN